MLNYTQHLIKDTSTVRESMSRLNDLGDHLTLFVLDESNRLIGTVTDGDIRRGLIEDVTIHDTVDKIMNTSFKYLNCKSFTLQEIQDFRIKQVKLLPFIDESKQIVKIVNFQELRSILPVEAVIMAGGEGVRLRPLTLNIPKPLINVGGKTILAHNLDRLELFGIDNISITVRYLAQQIIDFCSGSDYGDVNLRCIEEDEPLGTIGSLSLISEFAHDTILLMNSDVLTNIELEDFYMEFINTGAEIAVATIPYNVEVPYAVLETKDSEITSCREKPTYTYHSNAGIYLMKRSLIELLPKHEFFNATDLVDLVIKMKRKVVSYPLLGYWLDIGKHADLKKANEDIKHVRF